MFSGLFKPAHCAVCILGELAGGGSVALSVAVRNRWQVTGDMKHVTCDTLQVTCDKWHVTCDTWHYFFSSSSFFISVCFGISVNVRTGWEIQYLPYVGFFFIFFKEKVLAGMVPWWFLGVQYTRFVCYYGYYWLRCISSTRSSDLSLRQNKIIS